MERRTLVWIGSAAVVACFAVPVSSAVRERLRTVALAETYATEVARAKSLGVKLEFSDVLADLPKLGSQDASALVSLMVEEMGPPTRTMPNRVPIGTITGLGSDRTRAIQARFTAMAREIGSKKTFAVWRTKADEEQVLNYQVPVSVTTGLVLLSMQAREFASQGRDEECLVNLKAMVQFGKMLSDCASLSSFNSRMNCLSITLQTVQESARLRLDDARFLGRLRAEVVSQVVAPDPRPAARNEAFLTMRKAQRALDSQSPVLASFGISRNAAATWQDQVSQRAAKAMMLTSWNDMVEEMDQAWPAWDKLVVAAQNAGRNNHGTRRAKSPEAAIARGFAPSFVGAVSTGLHMEGRRALVSTWLRVLESRAETGELPQVVADADQDPYAGKPLHYQRRDNSFVLYSVGANGRDDGGTLSTMSSAGGSDVGFDTAKYALTEIQGH